jgi:hypothetical protein
MKPLLRGHVDIAKNDNIWAISATEADIFTLFKNPKNFVESIKKPTTENYLLNNDEDNVTIVVSYDAHLPRTGQSADEKYIVHGVDRTSLIRICAPAIALQASEDNQDFINRTEKFFAEEFDSTMLEVLYEHEPPREGDLCFAHHNPSLLKSPFLFYSVYFALSPLSFLTKLQKLTIISGSSGQINKYPFQFRITSTFTFVAVVPADEKTEFTGTQPCNKAQGTYTIIDGAPCVYVDHAWVSAYADTAQGTDVMHKESKMLESQNSLIDTASRGTLIKRKIKIKETYQPK